MLLGFRDKLNYYFLQTCEQKIGGNTLESLLCWDLDLIYDGWVPSFEASHFLFISAFSVEDVYDAKFLMESVDGFIYFVLCMDCFSIYGIIG